MQAQVPNSPYVGLWSRVAGFRPEALSTLLVERKAVRVVLMRSTIHLVSSQDALALRPRVQPSIGKELQGRRRQLLAGLDLDQVAAEGRRLVEARPLTYAELGQALVERWPGRDAITLAMVVRARVPLVQVPPRGVWGQGGRPTLTSTEAWLGRPPVPALSVEQLVQRYLGAFGPASVADAQSWSGLTRLRAVFDELRPRLRVFRSQEGRELFDLPGAPLPGPDTPAPVRFLPEFDNILLAHADRRRIYDARVSQMMFTANGLLPTVLVDGFVRGTWRLRRAGRAATLAIEAQPELSAAEEDAVTREGRRLLELLAPGPAQVEFPRRR